MPLNIVCLNLAGPNWSVFRIANVHINSISVSVGNQLILVKQYRIGHALASGAVYPKFDSPQGHKGRHLFLHCAEVHILQYIVTSVEIMDRFLYTGGFTKLSSFVLS